MIRTILARCRSTCPPLVANSRQDIPKKIQRFFTDHTDEVLCFDTHPSGSLVASGQKGRLPKVPNQRRACFPLTYVCDLNWVLHLLQPRQWYARRPVHSSWMSKKVSYKRTLDGRFQKSSNTALPTLLFPHLAYRTQHDTGIAIVEL